MRLTIESLVHGGRGLARADGVVFVPFVLPGEVVEAEIVEKRKGFSIARLTEVLEPSPRRVEPPCPYFGRCGGCQWQHAAYDAQVEYKQAILRETLRRTGKVEPEFLPPLSGGPHGYRRRASFQTGPDGSLGFFGEHSHTLVPVDRCLLLDGPLNTLLPALAGCRGWLSGLSAIEATSGQEGVLLGLFGDPPKRSVLEALVEELPGVAGAVHVRSGAFAGARSVSIPAGEVELTVSAGSFFQANAALNARAGGGRGGFPGTAGGEGGPGRLRRRGQLRLRPRPPGRERHGRGVRPILGGRRKKPPAGAWDWRA